MKTLPHALVGTVAALALAGLAGCGGDQPGPSTASLWHETALPVHVDEPCTTSGQSLALKLGGGRAGQAAWIPLVQATSDPRGQRFAGFGGGATVRIVNATTGQSDDVWSLPADKPEVSFEEGSLAWSPDGQALAFATVLERPGGAPVATTHVWNQSTKAVTSIRGMSMPAWSPSGRFLATGPRGERVIYPSPPFVVARADGRGAPTRLRATRDARWLPQRDALVLLRGAPDSSMPSTRTDLWEADGTTVEVGPGLETAEFPLDGLQPVPTSPNGRWIGGIARGGKAVVMSTSRSNHSIREYELGGLLNDSRLPDLASFYTSNQPVKATPIALALTNTGVLGVATVQVVDEDVTLALMQWMGSGERPVSLASFARPGWTYPSRLSIALNPSGAALMLADSRPFGARNPATGPWVRRNGAVYNARFAADWSQAFKQTEGGRGIVWSTTGAPRSRVVMTGLNVPETYTDSINETTANWAASSIPMLVATCAGIAGPTETATTE